MFKLKAKIIDVETGGIPVISLNEEFANKNDFHPMDRVIVKFKNRSLVAAIDTSEKIITEDEIGLFEDVWKKLRIKEGDEVEITPVEKPESTKFIRKKMDREELSKEEIFKIVKDIVEDKLTDVELTAFVSASYMEGLSMQETASLTRAIVDTGGRLRLKKKIIADKHSIGGVPGNRVTMVIVPIITSLGITMPKTSSRAITSPAGTADTMEVLADVSFSIEELTEIVKKTNGCIAWGGAINLAAADDKLIRVRHPLSLDPEGLMLASVMAKKVAVGATHVVFDLPVGEEAKLHSLGEARHLERMFKRLADVFKIKIRTIVTDGNEPIGHGIGPSLEARDVLWLLKNDRRAPMDLRRKSVLLAGKLLELIGYAKEGTGEKIAEKQIKNGKAYKKFMEIIEAQGGNPKIKPEDLPIGEFKCDYEAEKYGRIDNIDNKAISKIARAAGCPIDKEAGIYLYKHYGEVVKPGEKIFTVYSRSERRIERAIKLMNELSPITIK
ncbi:MAG: AMP phosphorylase [Nanoarchaeota archaeon]|nr:AMP phosphorylase [Nanoarchaeota archaeon]